MHTYKLTTKCNLCAYLYALWLNVWELGLAIHGGRGSQRWLRPSEGLGLSQHSTYAVLLQKRVCRNIRSFSDNKCHLFTSLGGGGRRKGTMSPFLPFFFISGLPLYPELRPTACKPLGCTKCNAQVFKQSADNRLD